MINKYELMTEAINRLQERLDNNGLKGLFKIAWNPINDEKQVCVTLMAPMDIDNAGQVTNFDSECWFNFAVNIKDTVEDDIKEISNKVAYYANDFEAEVIGGYESNSPDWMNVDKCVDVCYKAIEILKRKE